MPLEVTSVCRYIYQPKSEMPLEVTSRSHIEKQICSRDNFLKQPSPTKMSF